MSAEKERENTGKTGAKDRSDRKRNEEEIKYRVKSFLRTSVVYIHTCIRIVAVFDFSWTVNLKLSIDFHTVFGPNVWRTNAYARAPVCVYAK